MTIPDAEPSGIVGFLSNPEWRFDNWGRCHTLDMVSDMVKLTFTVDIFTADTIRELAEQWGVPKSEVVRKAIRQAKERSLVETTARTPVTVLEHLAQEPLLSDVQKRTRLAAARQLRKDWSRGRGPGRR
jgi:transposase-like protein